jgi:dTDP-4-amino-4,6-dideoxygalactose transaminase
MLLIEDNAHGLFGTVNGRPLGTFGALSCLSFHGTKNVSCGEGGAIVLNDGDLLERAEVVLEKGTDRQQYLRGQVDKYTWRDIGSSFGLSDYLAAILVEQLQQVDQIQRRRGELFNRYVDLLSPRCEELRLRLPFVESGHQPAHHLFYVLLSNADARDTLLSRMRDAGVGASFHYPPLHQSPGGRTWGDGATARCPTSEKVAASIVRLPLDHRMSESVVDQAVEVFLSSLANLRGA